MAKKAATSPLSFEALKTAVALLEEAATRGFTLREGNATRSHIRDFIDDARTMVTLLHFPPGTEWWHVREAVKVLGSTLPAAPWDPGAPHSNPVVCDVLHDELPPRFSKEWLSRRTSVLDEAKQCRAVKASLQVRIQEAKRIAAFWKRRYGVAPVVDATGDLTFPADIDPFADIAPGSALQDSPELLIDRIEVAGRCPDDSRLSEEALDAAGVDYAENLKELSWVGEVLKDDGELSGVLMYQRHGLFARFFVHERPLELDAIVTLGQVPVGHKYRVADGTVRKAGVTSCRSDELVTYLGAPAHRGKEAPGSGSRSKRSAPPDRSAGGAGPQASPEPELPGQLLMNFGGLPAERGPE